MSLIRPIITGLLAGIFANYVIRFGFHLVENDFVNVMIFSIIVLLIANIPNFD